VLGTSNKTELLLGYGTLHGDMASAINPIGDLYKTQVWALAACAGVRQKRRAPTCGSVRPTRASWDSPTSSPTASGPHDHRRASDEALVEKASRTSSSDPPHGKRRPAQAEVHYR
jgi:hypothetical protein